MVKLFKNLFKAYSAILFVAFAVAIVILAFTIKASVVLYTVAALYMLAMVYISKFVKSKIDLAIVCSIATVFMLYLVFAIKNVQISDFEQFYNAGLDIKYGRRDYLAFDKFLFWQFQVGYSSYIALLLNIWESEYIIKLSNVFWAIFASLCIYGITKNITKNNKTANLALVIHLFFPARLIMLPVITNQFIASALIYFAVYLWLALDNTKIKNIIVIALVLAIANITRTIAILAVAAIILFELLKAINIKSYKATILKLTKLCLCYLIIFNCIAYTFMLTGLSPNGLKNDTFLWKVAIGTNHEYHGAYNPQIGELLYGSDITQTERTALTKQVIKNNLSQGGKMLTLPIEKITRHFLGNQPTEYTFNNISNNTVNILGKNYNADLLINNYIKFERIFFFIVLMLSMLTVVSYKKDVDDKLCLPLIIFAAYIFIHLIIEIQARYMFFLFGLMAMFAAIAINNIENKITNKIINKITNKKDA